VLFSGCILDCDLDAYLIVIMTNHFHFVYFRDQCKILLKFCEVYDV